MVEHRAESGYRKITSSKTNRQYSGKDFSKIHEKLFISTNNEDRYPRITQTSSVKCVQEANLCSEFACGISRH